MQIENLQREFSYNGAKLADPAPTFTLQQVRDFYSQTYPELTNAEIEGPVVKGNRNAYTFRRAVGTKGTDMRSIKILGSTWYSTGAWTFSKSATLGVTGQEEPDNVRAQLDALLTIDGGVPHYVQCFLSELDRFSSAHVCPLLDEEVAFINALHARYCSQSK
ncbi:PRTRC system protein C [Burkholderia ubonensis]|uniref:PRTRC system protein C n=1 Tax=Burkholderia ubonensis TaxID=101571 RepID=UPI0007C6DDB6|nr:PRTRC system protein C [Burkholderia ubonensis]